MFDGHPLRNHLEGKLMRRLQDERCEKLQGNSCPGWRKCFGAALVSASKSAKMKHLFFGLGMVAILIGGASSDGAHIVLVVDDDPVLGTPRSVVTDGVDLYLAGSNATSGTGVFRVPIGGGAVTQLYSAVSPNGVTLVGSDVFWIDANSGPITDTEVLKAPKSGAGPVTAIYTGSDVGQPIVDGSDITTDGTTLYTVDQFGGQVHSMDTSGGGLTDVSPDRFGGGFSTERNPNIALDGGTLYVGDNGHPSGTGPPGVFSVPATGGSFTTLFSSTYPALSQLAGIAVGNGTIFLTEGNEILSMPVGGGTPTTFATDPSFGFLRGMTIFGNKLYVVGSTNTAVDGIWSIVIPEPSTFALAALGLLGIGWRRRKRV